MTTDRDPSAELQARLDASLGGDDPLTQARVTATASRTQPVAEHCPSCGTKLGEWFDSVLVINRKGHIVRVLAGDIEVLCPHCGALSHLTVPRSLDGMRITT